jgi:hypothetical protein
MKRAVSISLGSSDRDKQVEVDLLGETVLIERRGTDGDIEKATALFTELDGQVDAFGIGGIDLWVQMGDKRYDIRAAQVLVKNVKQTPFVDGSGLKMTLERKAAQLLVDELGEKYRGSKVMLTVGVDRYGMTLGFNELGCDMVFGDIMFALGVGIPVHGLKNMQRLAKVMVPIATKLPISILYPTGEKQDEIVPKFTKWYEWADVIAGDCHYIKRHMPEDLTDTVIVTNTTTEKDMALFKERNVQYVVTSTPILNGRSFGTNMMEAAITAVVGKNRALAHAELDEILMQLDMKPTLHKLV